MEELRVRKVQLGSNGGHAILSSLEFIYRVIFSLSLLTDVTNMASLTRKMILPKVDSFVEPEGKWEQFFGTAKQEKIGLCSRTLGVDRAVISDVQRKATGEPPAKKRRIETPSDIGEDPNITVDVRFYSPVSSALNTEPRITSPTLPTVSSILPSSPIPSDTVSTFPLPVITSSATTTSAIPLTFTTSSSVTNSTNPLRVINSSFASASTISSTITTSSSVTTSTNPLTVINSSIASASTILSTTTTSSSLSTSTTLMPSAFLPASSIQMSVPSISNSTTTTTRAICGTSDVLSTIMQAMEIPIYTAPNTTSVVAISTPALTSLSHTPVCVTFDTPPRCVTISTPRRSFRPLFTSSSSSQSSSACSTPDLSIALPSSSAECTAPSSITSEQPLISVPSSTLTLASSTTPEIPSTPSLSMKDRALSLLSHGRMPVFPPAPRSWDVEEVITLPSGMKWPPKAWKSMQPDQRLMSWEFAALSQEALQSSNSLYNYSRADILHRYNFLSLPGSKMPKITDKTAEMSRFYNFKVLTSVATSEKTDQTAIQFVHTMERIPNTDIVTTTIVSAIEKQHISLRL